MSYLDRLLEKIEDAEARLKLTAIATAHPEFSNWIVDPAVVTKAKEMSDWAAESWDDEHGMTKEEYRYSLLVDELQTQVAAATDQGKGIFLLNLGEERKDKNTLTLAPPYKPQ